MPPCANRHKGTINRRVAGVLCLFAQGVSTPATVNNEGVAEQHAAKVSIVGVGSVGTAIAYARLIRGSAQALALYDMNAKKVRAEVLDLNHGSQFVPNCVVTGSDSIDVTAGSAIVVVTAGAKQKAGQSRLNWPPPMWRWPRRSPRNCSSSPRTR